MSLLSESFLEKYRRRGTPFGNMLPYPVWSSSYRYNLESYTDTIHRSVIANLGNDARCDTTEAEELFDLMWNMQILPSGRALRVSGRGLPVAARYACHGTVLRRPEDLHYMAMQLFAGGGVGMSLLEIHLLPVSAVGDARLTVLCNSSHPNVGEVSPDDPVTSVTEYISVPDSREGWCDAILQTILAALEARSIVFNVSSVRARGEPIKRFGGFAPGPGPLVQMLRAIFATIRKAAGGQLTSVDWLDVITFVGQCIKSAGARRSALLILSKVDDRAFIEAKRDFSLVLSHRSSSNNSIAFTTEAEYDNFDWDAFVEDLAKYGEPGFVGLWKIWQDDPDVVVTNPCKPAFAHMLTPEGIRKLADIDVGSTVWSGKRWTTVTAKWATGVKPVFQYRTTAGSVISTEDHRVVCEGRKVKAKDADSIDIAKFIGNIETSPLDPQDILDGLMIGDGTRHKCNDNKLLLCVGEKDGVYFHSEIAPYLLSEYMNGRGHSMWAVKTTIEKYELDLTFNRVVPDRFLYGDTTKLRGFLRGLYSANGSIAGERVALKATSRKLIDQVQQMLSALGIASFVTTNKPTVVQFNNGPYECKESYDLNIGTRAGRLLFQTLIGFIHPYKNEKLSAKIKPIKKFSRVKNTFDVQEVIPLGEHPVFDLTVEADEHTYWTGGMLVSNCSEILLHPREACCLVEVFPARFKSHHDPERIFRLATRYTLRQRLEPMEDPEAEVMRVKNMRIGVSISGFTDFDWTPELLQMWAAAVDDEANTYADKLDVARPIAKKTVKPSGTLSILASSSPGVHAPFAPYYIRRVRIMKAESSFKSLESAGVPWEDCCYDQSGHTAVFSFPMKAPEGATVFVSTESAVSQMDRVLAVQDNWTDNSVSATITFRPHEKQEIADYLRANAKRFKCLSFLPYSNSYAQAPYEEIDKDTYDALVAKIDLSQDFDGKGMIVEDCEGGACPI